MRWWRLFAVVVTGGVSLAVAEACSTDSFSPDGGDAAGNDAVAPNPQGDFCDAEATYFARCSYTGACFKQALAQCGNTYSYFAAAVTAAYADCVGKNQLTCSTDFGTVFNQPCIQDDLKNFVNDSGALAKLGQDFCSKCLATDTTCLGKFNTGSNSVGYFPSLFDDAVINKVDQNCAQPPASDAAVYCETAYGLCELYTIGNMVQGISCADASID